MLYGPDLDELEKYGDKIADVIRGVPGAVDVRVEQVAGLRSLRIVPDRTKLQRYGITVDEINRLAQTLSVGLEAGDVLEGERRFEIVVKTAISVPGDLEPILNLPLRAATGQIVPLGDVAEVTVSNAPAEISRDSQPFVERFARIDRRVRAWRSGERPGVSHACRRLRLFLK